MSTKHKLLTKYFAIGTFAPGVTQEQWQPYMPKEVPATLQLYLDGKMDQFWLREDGQGVIFVMTTESRGEAESLLKSLPLGQAGLLQFELIAVGPLAPLGMLLERVTN